MREKAEFDGQRAKLYEEAITEYPEARKCDLECMYHLLNPQEEESILGFGEGNGYFASEIAKAIGPSGRYLVVDPSGDQLRNLESRAPYSNIETKVLGVEAIAEENTFDKVWSFGAFHHVHDQTKAFESIYGALKPGGLAIICDVFQGTTLAQHFDSFVARYCETGHEVKFLSDEFANTLAYLAGFDSVTVQHLNIIWEFQNLRAMGDFIYKLHALTKLPGTVEEKVEETGKSCVDILGTCNVGGKLLLNWPMKSVIAKK